MDRVITQMTFDEEQVRNAPLEYWLSRPPEERIAEVERLRREYWTLQGNGADEPLPQLCRSVLLIEREGR